MKIGISYARNPFLVKRLKEILKKCKEGPSPWQTFHDDLRKMEDMGIYMENLRYIDQLGRGIPMIIKSMKEAGAKEPLLQESGEEFVLTVFKA